MHRTTTKPATVTELISADQDGGTPAATELPGFESFRDAEAGKLPRTDDTSALIQAAGYLWDSVYVQCDMADEDEGDILMGLVDGSFTVADDGSSSTFHMVAGEDDHLFSVTVAVAGRVEPAP